MLARVKKMNLPDAPSPTKPVRVQDPRESERQSRIQEHKELNLGTTKPICFWDKARTAKLRRLWEEGHTVKHIAQECGCEVNVCRNRIGYEIKNGRIESRRQEITPEETKSILARYKAGEGLNAIAREMKTSRYNVAKVIKENQNEK